MCRQAEWPLADSCLPTLWGAFRLFIGFPDFGRKMLPDPGKPINSGLSGHRKL